MLYSGIDLHKRSLVIHILDGATTREAQLNSVGGAGPAYFGTFAGESTFAAFKHMFLASDGAYIQPAFRERVEIHWMRPSYNITARPRRLGQIANPSSGRSRTR